VSGSNGYRELELAGGAERFDWLFDRHFGSIHRYLRRRVGKDLADELTAETFARALAGRANFQHGISGPRAWLFGIAANLLRRHYRDEERMLRAYTRRGPDPISDEPPVLERVDAQLRAPYIASALRRLPRHERDVLLLHAWADLDYAEVAEALAIPIGTVRSRLHRARIRIRKLLAETGQTLDELSTTTDQAAPEEVTR
jgi:RNA polymerase sigma-70 factor (ECF subfamily)